MLKITYYVPQYETMVTIHTLSPLMFKSTGIEFMNDSHLAFLEYNKIYSVEEVPDPVPENR